MRLPFSLFSLIMPALLLASGSVPVQAHGSHAPASTAPIRVACVGDSITYGVGSTNPSVESYPAQLGRMLGQGWDVQNFGDSGRTLLKKGDMPYWTEPALTNAEKFLPNYVIIMLGTNDTKPQNWKYQAQFAADYVSLIQVFKSLPSHPKIFICRPIPVRGNGNYGINEPALLQEMPIIDQVAKEQKVKEIDMFAALENNEYDLADNVHPNDNGAGLIAKAAFHALTGQNYLGFIPVPVPIAPVGPAIPDPTAAP